MEFEIVDSDLGSLPTRTLPTILCCVCGISIQSNPANMCVDCLRNQVDITEGIPKQIILHQCRTCLRFLRPPWVACEFESKELLAICLKKITGLNKVKLIDAGFIWTEPHSRRIKVKLTIQKDVLNGVKLQQVFAVEFLLQNQQCDVCQRSFTDHTWRAQVQVRQKVDHKKTFYLLEQLIIKHGAHEKCINVEQVPTGIDFSFAEKSHALKFMDFIGSVVPTRSKAAKQLISEDIHQAFQNFKFTYAVEIVPLCKDDLLVLPPKTAQQCGNISPVVLVLRVSSNTFLLDPRSLQIVEMSADKYWRDPFRALMSTSQMEEFTVLDVTPVTIAPISGAALRRKKHHSRVKRAKRSRHEDSDDDEEGSDDDDTSVAPSASVYGGNSTYAGGFTGAVSLAGGSVHFNGAMSVASTVTGGPRGRMLLADAEVVRTRDLGVSDQRFIVRTHLGNILRPGDCVMGYDLTNAVYNDVDAENDTNARMRSTGKGQKQRSRGGAGGRNVDLPDIVLVRKVTQRQRQQRYVDLDPMEEVGLSSLPADARARKQAQSGAQVDSMEDDVTKGTNPIDELLKEGKSRKERVWRVKRFDDVMRPGQVRSSESTRRSDLERAAKDYEEFLQELETDKSLRKGVNMFKDEAALARRKAAAAAAASAAAGSAADDEDEDEGDIGLEELLDELTINGKARPADVEEDEEEGDAIADEEDTAFLAKGAWKEKQDPEVVYGEIEDDEEGLALLSANRKNLDVVSEDAENEEEDDL